MNLANFIKKNKLYEILLKNKFKIESNNLAWNGFKGFDIKIFW